VEDTRQRDSSRAVRYAIRVPVQFRPFGNSSWEEGWSENISRTGILVRVSELLERDTKIEISFALDPKTGSREGTHITCTGQVARTVPKSPQLSPALGVRILDYSLARPAKDPD
jgi:hypothetical protein